MNAVRGFLLAGGSACPKTTQFYVRSYFHDVPMESLHAGSSGDRFGLLIKV